MEKNKQVLAEAIHKWEQNAGESFTDYFMHDRVKDVSWAFWLLGKGYSERANMLIDLIQAGNKCIDQELLYHLHMTEEWDEELYSKDIDLWADFLTASDRYFKEIEGWFKDYA